MPDVRTVSLSVNAGVAPSDSAGTNSATMRTTIGRRNFGAGEWPAAGHGHPDHVWVLVAILSSQTRSSTPSGANDHIVDDAGNENALFERSMSPGGS